MDTPKSTPYHSSNHCLFFFIIHTFSNKTPQSSPHPPHCPFNSLYLSPDDNTLPSHRVRSLLLSTQLSLSNLLLTSPRPPHRPPETRLHPTQPSSSYRSSGGSFLSSGPDCFKTSPKYDTRVSVPSRKSYNTIG